MAKPGIFTIDDEHAVLCSVERDLRGQYGREFRIMKADSGAAALEAPKQLKARGDAVALFLTDQRMPHMSGTQFLEQARNLFPEARKVLLTAYADRGKILTLLGRNSEFSRRSKRLLLSSIKSGLATNEERACSRGFIF